MAPLHGRLLRAAALGAALAACASTGGGTPAGPGDDTALSKEEKEGFPVPDGLEVGDRWYVAVRPGESRAPFAVRNRRVRAGDLVREEVVWGKGFADVAKAGHGTMQVTGLLLDGKGLSLCQLDESGRPVGESPVEVALPLKPGTAWDVSLGGGRPPVQGLVEKVEEVETPAGKVRALRVSQRALAGEVRTSTIWYDRGLRPVRFEFRQSGALVEASAALASAEPTPEECRLAVEWASKNLSR